MGAVFEALGYFRNRLAKARKTRLIYPNDPPPLDDSGSGVVGVVGVVEVVGGVTTGSTSSLLIVIAIVLPVTFNSLGVTSSATNYCFQRLRHCL